MYEFLDRMHSCAYKLLYIYINLGQKDRKSYSTSLNALKHHNNLARKYIARKYIATGKLLSLLEVFMTGLGVFPTHTLMIIITSPGIILVMSILLATLPHGYIN